MLRFKSLGSGSSGNATLVQVRGATRATHLLVDCGLSLRQLDKRLLEAGMLADQVDGIFITHEHGDHVGCARLLALRERIPVYMSAGTYAGIGQPAFDGLLRIVEDGASFELGDMQVTPFSVPHDAREPLQLRCTDGATRLGVLTDLGHVTPQVLQQLWGCRSLVLECNHDEEMLAAGPYPWFLKRRVGGEHGHLANSAAAQAVRALIPSGLQQVMAAHLSKQNNRPELARAALAAAMSCGHEDIHVADASRGCDWLTA